MEGFYAAYEHAIIDLADPRTKGWKYFESPISMMIIVAMYIVLICKLGPQYMATRRRYILRKAMMVYDAGQMLACLYIVLSVGFLCPRGFTNLNWRCSEIYYTDEYKQELKVTTMYHRLKLLDLVETAFHVLRKNDNQLHFLNFYHHSMMVVMSWLMVKYIAGGHSLFLITINSFVHFFMFLHYLRTVVSKTKLNNSWWKTHEIKTQFLHISSILWINIQPFISTGCEFPRGILGLGVLQNILYMLLYLFYYVKYCVLPYVEENF